MKKLLLISFLFVLAVGFNCNYDVYPSEKKGRIIGDGIIYGKVVNVDYANNIIIVTNYETNANKSFSINRKTEFSGVDSIKDIKIGDDLALKGKISDKGEETLLEIIKLENPPDFTNHPD